MHGPGAPREGVAERGVCCQGVSQCSHHGVEHHDRQRVALVHTNPERDGLGCPGGTGEGSLEVGVEVGDNSVETGRGMVVLQGIVDETVVETAICICQIQPGSTA